jgi:hypothetical protein
MTKNPSKNSNKIKWEEKWTQIRASREETEILDGYRKEIGMPSIGLSKAAVHAINQLRKINKN